MKEGDRRSFRVALTSDRYVNPAPGGVDGVAAASQAGWGVMQLPSEDYPSEVVVALLREVAEQAEEFWRHGYDLVAIGDSPGLVEALAALGMPPPDRIVPADQKELVAFLEGRPLPAAARPPG